MSDCTLEKADGAQLLDQLPKSYRARWSPERKALVVQAVQEGVMSFNDASERYRLSRREYLTWEDAFGKGGVEGANARNREARG